VKVVFGILLKVLLKRKFKNFPKVISQLLSLDTVRFGAFLGVLKFLYKSVLCSMRHVRQKDDGLNHFTAGVISGLALKIETKGRKESWSLYFLSRGVDTALRILEEKGYPIRM
jgi:hypothetical protein